MRTLPPRAPLCKARFLPALVNVVVESINIIHILNTIYIFNIFSIIRMLVSALHFARHASCRQDPLVSQISSQFTNLAVNFLNGQPLVNLAVKTLLGNRVNRVTVTFREYTKQGNRHF